MNIPQPSVPTSHWIGARAPWVRSRYPPWPFRIDRSTLAIELRAALAQPEERSLRQEERHVRRLRVERQPLHRHAGRSSRRGASAARGEAHGQVPGAHRLEGLGHAPGPHAFRCVELGEPAIDWHRRRVPASRGSSVMRTVAGLSDDTAISTGFPPIRMPPRWPRMMPPERVIPAPAAVMCLSAARRVID